MKHYSEELLDEYINSIYEDYKELCDAIISEILKEKKSFTKNDKFVKACAVFYVLGNDEARLNGKAETNLKEYIDSFIPEITSIIENSIAHSPKTFIMPNHKVINSISKYGAEGYNEIAAGNLLPKYPDIKTTAKLIFDENISLPKNYTQYDRAVLNAICSLYEAGNSAFTPLMVFRTMTGRTNEEFIEPSNLTRVVKSIEKQRTAIVKIDGSEELKKRNIKGCDRLVFDENILNLTAAEVRINGANTKGYIFLKKPILYRYCELTKQVITVPIHLLNTKTVKSTPEIIVIKEYLIRQIELLKNGYRNNKNILYDTIFSECGITTTNRTVVKRYRDYIKKLLEEWKTKEYIKAYKEYTKGRKILGIVIDY